MAQYGSDPDAQQFEDLAIQLGFGQTAIGVISVVNPDGSGSMTFFSFGGTNKTRTFNIADSGQEIKYVETDDPDEGAVTSGTLVRQGLPGRD